MAESVRVDPDLLASVAAHLDGVSRMLDEAEGFVRGLDHYGAFQAAQPDAAWSHLQAATQRACAELDQAVVNAARALREGTETMRAVDEELKQSLDGFITAGGSG